MESWYCATTSAPGKAPRAHVQAKTGATGAKFCPGSFGNLFKSIQMTTRKAEGPPHRTRWQLPRRLRRLPKWGLEGALNALVAPSCSEAQATWFGPNGLERSSQQCASHLVAARVWSCMELRARTSSQQVPWRIPIRVAASTEKSTGKKLYFNCSGSSHEVLHHTEV